MSPYSLIALNTRMVALAVESQTVMALRILAMGGFIPARRGENRRMIDEKPAALWKAYAAGLDATLAGGTPDQIIDAAIRPLGRRVRANRRRLMK